jgi:propionate CoA-transferase
MGTPRAGETTGNPRVLEAADAVAAIPDGATVAISGGSYRAVPESVLEAIERRFLADGRPRGLTVVATSMVERGRKGVGGDGTGLNRLARAGLMSRLIVSSFSRSREARLNVFVKSPEVAAYNLPMGTILQLLRASGAGRDGLFTEVGIGTYIDPRVEGGRVSPVATQPLSEVITVRGRERLFYPRLQVDVGLVKATSADERGNLYLDHEAYDHGVWDVAMAARRGGGMVIAEVNRLVKTGEVHPRMGRIPGPLVDAIVLRPDPWEDEQDPRLTGDAHGTPQAQTGTRPRDLIARNVVALLPPNAMVNLGAGLPMYDVPGSAYAMAREDLYFTVEQGPMGGWPQVGGATLNPEMIFGQLEVFDFYEGGGPDASVLAFGQIDKLGNVNVSRFGDMLPGCGGFVNIVHGARWLIFCGTLTTKGLSVAVADGQVKVADEGMVRRFVEAVEQVTFNGQLGVAAGKRVTVVTDRAIFEVGPDGFEVTAVMPGISVRRDVLPLIPFPVRVARELTPMLLPEE